jgi:hypothetical protein
MLLGVWLGFYPFALAYQKFVWAYVSRLSQVFEFDLGTLLIEGKVKAVSVGGVDIYERIEMGIVSVIEPIFTGWYEPKYGWLNAIELLLLLTGLIVLIWNLRRSIKPMSVILMAFLPALVVTVLLDDPIEAQRLVTTFVWVSVVMAVGFGWLVERYRGFGVSRIINYRLLLAIVLIGISVINIYKYFVLYTPKRSYGRENTWIATDFSKRVEMLDEGSGVMFIGGGRMHTSGFSHFKYFNQQLEFFDDYKNSHDLCFRMKQSDVVAFLIEGKDDFKKCLGCGYNDADVVVVKKDFPKTPFEYWDYYMGSDMFLSTSSVLCEDYFEKDCNTSGGVLYYLFYPGEDYDNVI